MVAKSGTLVESGLSCHTLCRLHDLQDIVRGDVTRIRTRDKNQMMESSGARSWEPTAATM